MVNILRNWATQNADRYLYVPIPRERTDTAHSSESLEPDQSYFRLWLSEMFLTTSRRWFRDWYPSVQSTVKLNFGGKNGVEFSRVARVSEERLGQGVQLNYRLTELMPFKGGVVEIEAGLIALQGADYLKAVIGMLQDFSTLVAAPLGQALDVAEKVSSSMGNLLSATDGEVHLTLHQTFVSKGGGGGNDLKPGYIAIILATKDQVSKERLCVKNDQLLYSAQPGKQPTSLQGYDYMLFRIESRKERDDWRLKNIEDPLQKATEALLMRDMKGANFFGNLALSAAMVSPDLTINDRRRVVQAIKEELKQIADLGLGAVGGEVQNLNEIMATRAIPVEQAAALGEISLDELFADWTEF